MRYYDLYHCSTARRRSAILFQVTAVASGDVVAYFTGSGAGFDNQAGLLVNGVQQGGFGLDDKTSAIGDAFNFGPVTAGDSLIFVMNNRTSGTLAYSDPSLNIAYDDPGDTIGHNHVYSTAYTATSPIIGAPGVIPVGIHVGFEDEPFPKSDFNYSDETFVEGQGHAMQKGKRARTRSAYLTRPPGLVNFGQSLQEIHR